MVKCTRQEAHLLLAGIRVLTHLNERSPQPDELAGFLNLPAGSLRLQVALLVDMGAIVQVESAFETHLGIGDHAVVETLSEAEGPAISADLHAFDQRKQEEAERMAHLFDSGDQQQRQQERISQMDEDLLDFKNKKKINPFGE